MYKNKCKKISVYFKKYGHQDGNMFDEVQVPKPMSNGVKKYGCEMDIQICGEQHGLDYSSFPDKNGMESNKTFGISTEILGIWMFQYLNDEKLTIFGDGSQAA